MNVKIQGGGGGNYANAGSCAAVTSYLQHEDIGLMAEGEDVSPFFNQSRDYVSENEVVFGIDSNKAKLCKNDAKFFVITVSPSSAELAHLGGTRKEQMEAMMRYVRQEVIPSYAEGFGKGLTAKDIKYYAKIHFERHGKNANDMHVHIIVSRKDMNNKIKLSPKTNHTGKKGMGTAKGGFDRKSFFQKCEGGFDSHFGYQRNVKESFQYLNAVKNGSIKDLEAAVMKAENTGKSAAAGLIKILGGDGMEM